MDYLLLGEDWNSLKRVSIPDSVRYYLDIARSRGARVFVQLAANHEHYQSPDGSFSLAKYKEQLDKYKEVDLNGYIEDGTIIGHLLVDEPNDPSNWGGTPMSYEMIEAAAQHSKSLWPRLPAVIRSRPTWLARAPFSWQFLDSGWGQYVARYGDVQHFRDIEVEAANRAGLMVVWGLNVINGGDGSSRKTGTRSDRFNMTASEVLRYGRVLLPLESSCGFLLWRYESAYVENEEVLSALKTLSKEAKDLPFRSCLQ